MGGNNHNRTGNWLDADVLGRAQTVKMMLPRNRINRPARRSHLWTGRAGIDFVRCRICGDRRRIINGRHLSKHAIDRETYMEEFGLSPDELAAKDWRSIRSSRKGYRPYDRREWIAELKRIYKVERYVSTKYLQRKYPLIYEQSLWIFGNWDKALRAAGLNPKTTRMRIVWDREKVIKGIQRFQKRSLPLYAQCVMKNDSALFHAGIRLFGSWNAALVAAGINKKQVFGMLRNQPSRILPTLRDALDNPDGDVPEALKLHAVHYFGSLRNAIVAAKTHPGWSKKRITSMLFKMHRNKTLLTYTGARREHSAAG